MTPDSEAPSRSLITMRDEKFFTAAVHIESVPKENVITPSPYRGPRYLANKTTIEGIHAEVKVMLLRIHHAHTRH